MFKADNISLILDKYIVLSTKTKDDREVSVSCEYINAEYDRLFLKFPDKKRDIIKYFIPQTTVCVSITSPKGLISYDGLILYNSPFPLLVVSYHTNQNSVSQQREFVRVDYVSKITINYKGEIHKCLTENVSCGGIKIISSIEIPKQETIYARLFLRDFQKAIDLTLKVLDCTQVDNSNFDIQTKIIGIDELDKKRLQKFCYDTQINSVE